MCRRLINGAEHYEHCTNKDAFTRMLHTDNHERIHCIVSIRNEKKAIEVHLENKIIYKQNGLFSFCKVISFAMRTKKIAARTS